MSNKTDWTHFLRLPPELRDSKSSLYHVIPVPYEETVCYGQGTRNGPRAILNASYQLDLFNGTAIPSNSGVFTMKELPVRNAKPAVAARLIEKAVSSALADGHIPVVLGGEHTITAWEIEAFRKHFDDFGIVHFDAHADLWNRYDGREDSHACVMRRIVEKGIPLFQIGIRTMGLEEFQFRKQMKIPHLDAVTIARHGLPARILPAGFPKNIFISFDIDGLDSALVPATGTPEPGGLSWFQAIFALENVTRGRKVIGCDVVELAPIRGMHAPDFVAAKLAYSIMGMVRQPGRQGRS